jgi:hypothetical protein
MAMAGVNLRTIQELGGWREITWNGFPFRFRKTSPLLGVSPYSSTQCFPCHVVRGTVLVSPFFGLHSDKAPVVLLPLVVFVLLRLDDVSDRVNVCSRTSSLLIEPTFEGRLLAISEVFPGSEKGWCLEPCISDIYTITRFNASGGLKNHGYES